MGIRMASKTGYARAIQDLFPKGEYWDRQFENPESDCSLFCLAKTNELIKFRRRMAALQNESVIQTVEETLEDWERVILDTNNSSLTHEQRRMLLFVLRQENVSREVIKQVGRSFGLDVKDIIIPFKPAFFGFSHFGTERLAGPASFSVLYINIAQAERSKEFENKILSILLSSHIVFFDYGGV